MGWNFPCSNFIYDSFVGLSKKVSLNWSYFQSWFSYVERHCLYNILCLDHWTQCYSVLKIQNISSDHIWFQLTLLLSLNLDIQNSWTIIKHFCSYVYHICAQSCWYYHFNLLSISVSIFDCLGTLHSYVIQSFSYLLL